MKNLQSAGGVAALIQAVGFLAILAIFLVVLPSQGFAVPTDFTNPTKVAAAAPVLGLLNWVTVLFSLTIVVVILAIYERLQARAPNRLRLAVAAAVVASGLFLATSMVGIVGGPLLAQDPAAGAALSALNQGLLNAAIFAAGWSSLLWGWAVSTEGDLPRPLGYLALLNGVIAILNFVVPPFQLLGRVVGLIWTAWLGIALLREAASAPVPHRAPAEAGP